MHPNDQGIVKSDDYTRKSPSAHYSSKCDALLFMRRRFRRARSFHSIHSPSPTYAFLNVAPIFKTPFGLAVSLCPAQSRSFPQPSFLPRVNAGTWQARWYVIAITAALVFCHANTHTWRATMPRLFRYQTHASRCTATAPDGNSRSIRLSVTASNSKLPLFPLGSRSRMTKKKKCWRNAANFKRIDWQEI